MVSSTAAVRTPSRRVFVHIDRAAPRHANTAARGTRETTDIFNAFEGYRVGNGPFAPYIPTVTEPITPLVPLRPLVSTPDRDALRFLQTAFTHVRVGFQPETSIITTADALIATLAVPGFTADQLTITPERTRLVVSGTRPALKDTLPEGATIVQDGMTSGAFSRFIDMPADVDLDAISASLEDGLLTITIPLPTPTAPRTIPIAGAQKATTSRDATP